MPSQPRQGAVEDPSRYQTRRLTYRTPLGEAVRAGAEFAAFTAALPRLRKAPKGDGHPVLVLPGLLASDYSTHPLRAYLRDRGYDAHGWHLGINRGPSDETAAALEATLRALAGAGRPVSIIGWSMGGVYALEVAGRLPHAVRQVITLGSPLTLLSSRAQQAPVPVSAVFSKTDAIVPWRSAILPAGSNRENVEVDGSHLGLGHNPKVLLIIANRLALHEGAWTHLNGDFHPDERRAA